MDLLKGLYSNTVGLFLAPKRIKETNTKKRRRDGNENNPDRYNTSLNRADQIITKRRRVDRNFYVPIIDSEDYEATDINCASASEEQQQRDRVLMPPPALNLHGMLTQGPDKQLESKFERDADLSQVSSTSMSTRQKLVNDEYNMERARRQAAAVTLPENSGVWERGEKELFYHLAYRGFEPLMPQNWMVDFKTMPLTIFQCEENPEPLIRSHNTTEFRAIRELRELLDLGKNLRDKVLASPGTASETMIEKAMNKYFSWALTDVGINIPSISKSTTKHRDTCLPIHVIVKMKSGQDTASCIAEVSSKLHALAIRHRQAKDLYPSVERELPSSSESSDTTRLVESLQDDLPVLYGFMICRSIVAIFTMNSFTPVPEFVRKKLYTSKKFNRHVTGIKTFTTNAPDESISLVPEEEQSKQERVDKRAKQHQKTGKDFEEADKGEKAMSHPRFIADFDFSDSATDVWNSLALAICAMQIRRDILIYLYGSDEIVRELGPDQTAVKSRGISEESDPDA